MENQSIEELENDYWNETEFSSYVSETCHRARKKPIAKLSYEEIRLMTGQKIGLKYLLPIAVSILEKNPLIEVTFFNGDLLKELLRLDIAEWKDNKTDLVKFRTIILDNYSLIKSCEEIPIKMTEKYLMDTLKVR
ncbi:MAG: contact-dependent growth inhibition system immunity protein [Alistipes senegalensis]|nr:contact-dependent growth inhibition system immunity protein [Alistipes senegalensis]